MIENANKNAVRLRKRYCKELRKELSDAPQLRGRVLRDTRTSLDEYLAKNAQADWDCLTSVFGTPQQAAQGVLNDLDAEQIKREARRYRWRRIIPITVIGLALVYVSFRLGRLAVNRLTEPGYVIISPAYESQEPAPTNTPVEGERWFW